MLVKKIWVMTIVFFMLISNVSVSLISAFSFAFENTNMQLEGINISSQYKFVKNAPKDFINLCVNISKDTSLFNIISAKFANIVDDKKFKDLSDGSILMVSGFKFKSVKIIERVFLNSNSGISQGTNIFYLFMVILIFYLIGYIGLLRVFNDSFCINKNIWTVKLCL
ncbi:MAG: hypothetical protein PHR82_00380 [Endomicrobiaceae bacterium]|nr:hypothetical protein [Endomicrobiaceae bacterium]